MIKKLYKKGLSALLTLCLLFSFLPVMPVQAAEFDADKLNVGDTISEGDIITKGSASFSLDYYYYEKADRSGNKTNNSSYTDTYPVETHWGIKNWRIDEKEKYVQDASNWWYKFHLVPAATPVEEYTVTPKYCTVDGRSEPTEYAVGDPVTVETREVTGATFTGWASEPDGVDFVKTGEYQAEFVMPGNDVTIYAVFKNNPEPSTEYTVAVKGGTADKDKCGEDEKVTVTADKPAEGYRFTKWTTESKGVNFEDPSKTETSFMMPAHDVSVTAEFEPIPAPVPTYPVTVEGGTADKAAYAAGETVKITAPDELAGGRFDNWSTDSKDVTFADAKAATTTFTMPANAVTVKANFKTAPVPPAAEYTVTVTNDGNGTAKAAPAKAQAGTKITLSATPNSGYHFKEWKVEKGGVTIAKDNTFTMPAGDVTVKAVFEKTTTNPVTGLPMSGGETGAFALITLSVLLLGTTVLKRKADR